MKTLRTLLTAASLTAAMLPATAMAYTFDFVDGNPNGADVFGERGVQDGTVLEFDGAYLEFSASKNTKAEGYAYFDASGNSGPAGLGVCGVLTSNDQCDPSSDDNLTEGELLNISFYSDANATQALSLKIDSIVFRDGQHNLITSTSANFLLDGIVEQMVGFSTTTGAQSYQFGWDNQQYYVSAINASAVPPTQAPAPASLAIILLGMGALATRRRFRHPA